MIIYSISVFWMAIVTKSKENSTCIHSVVLIILYSYFLISRRQLYPFIYLKNISKNCYFVEDIACKRNSNLSSKSFIIWQDMNIYN